MKMVNEKEIMNDWMPVLNEKTNVKDPYKLEWLSKYCHYHSLNEAADPYQTLGSLNPMGQPLAPTRTAVGSGDKFPSLLPLAIQVAAKTVGFDVVPVIPLPGPAGVLTYLDYVYAGGRIDGTTLPYMIKVQSPKSSGSYTVGTTYYGISGSASATSGDKAVALTYVGKSRIDGFEIWKVGTAYSYSGSPIAWNADTTVTIAQVFDGGALITSNLTASMTAVSGSVTGSASLVEALENHIQGFAGAGASDTSNWAGPFASSADAGPMNRETGESTYYRSMGLKTFTKFVEAKTYQVAASVTTEQIQDLNKQFGIDVVSMVENALVNEVSQAINKHILSSAFALGATNATNFAATEGQSLDLDLSAIYAPATASAVTGSYENLMTLQRRLVSRIVAAGTVIANRGRRGPSNFIVVGPQLASAIQDISQFVAAPFANSINQNIGTLYPMGTLAGMTVYVDQNMKWSDLRVLVGRKGGDDEPGLKFMPYMMAESIQTISEGTMSPKIAVKSRYALVEAGFHPETMYITFTVTLPTGGII